MNMKELLALGATLLIAISYTPYVRDVVKEKTVPHPYSWFISGFITFIVFGLQVNKGGGWGAVPTFFGASAGILIFILSLRYKRAAITKSDTLFFMMALIAIGLWLIAKQAVLSVIIVSLIDILAFIPTYRKSWKRPDQETASFYYVSLLRFILSAIAVGHYNFVTLLYPASSGSVDGSFALFLVLRRRTLAKHPLHKPTKEKLAF